MLKSVYTYGGFWIGRYETGIEGSIDDVFKARATHTDIEIGTSPKAISQKDAIPYNNIYCSEAQMLAKEMTPNSNYTSSLMFGIQWDLVCKFLEAKTTLEISDINLNSSAWENYDNVTRTITSNKAKQRGTPWTAITGTKPAGAVLLTTGASEETNKMNIYDFAGNEYEWTLEHSTINEGNPCARRGESYNSDGTKYSPADRGVDSIKNYHSSISFRTTLYGD